jgi:hypothetical protein
MLNCWPNRRRRFGSSVKSLLNEGKTDLLVPTSWRLMMMMYAVCPSVNEQCCCFRNKRKQWGTACISLWLSELQGMRRQHGTTFTVLTAYKVTIHNKCSNWPPLYQRTQGHVFSRTVAPFLRSRLGFEWSERHQICVGEVSVHFHLELNTLGFSSVPTVKNLKDWSRANAEAILWTLSLWGHTSIWNFVLTLMWEACSWNFPTF